MRHEKSSEVQKGILTNYKRSPSSLTSLSFARSCSKKRDCHTTAPEHFPSFELILFTPITHLICPFPKMIYFVVVRASSPIGPLAWSFWVLMPISAPNPNSNPSVNLVDAFT